MGYSAINAKTAVTGSRKKKAADTEPLPFSEGDADDEEY